LAQGIGKDPLKAFALCHFQESLAIVLFFTSLGKEGAYKIGVPQYPFIALDKQLIYQ
jgi:hypothetical protein